MSRNTNYFQQALFHVELAGLLEAGLTPAQAVEAVEKGGGGRAWQRALAAIAESLNKGRSLGESLAAHGEFFSRSEVAMITAGEKSGELPRVLSRLAEEKEHQGLVHDRIRRMLVGPAVALLVACTVMGILLTFAIPAFKELFSAFGSEMPMLTLFVVRLSDFFVAGGWVLLAGLAALLFSLSFKGVHDRVSAFLPFFRQVVQDGFLARFSESLSILLLAKTPMKEAIPLAALSADNLVLAERLRGVTAGALAGEAALVAALADSGLFTAGYLGLLTREGQAEQPGLILEKMARYHQRRLNHRMLLTLEIFNHLLMIFIGLLVGVFVIAMYLPIFQMGSAIG